MGLQVELVAPKVDGTYEWTPPSDAASGDMVRSPLCCLPSKAGLARRRLGVQLMYAAGHGALVTSCWAGCLHLTPHLPLLT